VRWLLFSSVIFFAFMSCSFSYGQEMDISGKVGEFIYSAGNIYQGHNTEFSEHWASYGYLIGGRISFHISGKSFICVDIDGIRSKKNSVEYAEGYVFPVSIKNQILSAFILYKGRLMKEGKIVPYICGGFGVVSMLGTTTIANISEDNYISEPGYKYLIGLDIGRRIFFEVGYMYGGRKGNTGISFAGGFMAHIGQ
jgi:hypothetical protein